MSSTNRICSALTLTVILASFALQASAATVFYDDFSDGSVTNGVPLDWNGNPVIWTERPNIGDYDATSGDYVFTSTTTGDFMNSSVEDIALTNTSIRTQVRTSEDDGAAFVLARVQAVPSTEGYFGGVEYLQNQGGTSLILGRVNADGNFTFFGDFPVLPFDVRTEDAVLQLDVIDNELKLWVWKAGDPMPDQPQVTATDSTYSGGTMRIANDREINIATFRYVHLADSHIPEPAAGDFDDSGAVGQGDLNLVLQNWGDTSPPVPAGWINEQPTGLIGQAYLNTVLQNWGNSVVASASAVPEPTTSALALAALCLVMSKRRMRLDRAAL
jgi:hypothetical protein